MVARNAESGKAVAVTGHHPVSSRPDSIRSSGQQSTFPQSEGAARSLVATYFSSVRLSSWTAEPGLHLETSDCLEAVQMAPKGLPYYCRLEEHCWEGALSSA